MRSARFRTCAAKPFATECLYADDRANHVSIDIHIAYMRGVRYCKSTAIDTGLHAQRQAIPQGIDLPDHRQGVARPAHDQKHRPENFRVGLGYLRQLKSMGGNVLCLGHPVLQQRLLPIRSKQAPVRRIESFHMCVNAIGCILVYDWAQVGCPVGRITHSQLGCSALQHLQHRVGDLVVQTEQTQSGATLTRRAKSTADDRIHYLLRQCAGVHQHGIHTPGLGNKGDDGPIHGGQSALDGLSNCRRTGKHHTRNVGLGHQRCPKARSTSV